MYSLHSEKSKEVNTEWIVTKKAAFRGGLFCCGVKGRLLLYLKINMLFNGILVYVPNLIV